MNCLCLFSRRNQTVQESPVLVHVLEQDEPPICIFVLFFSVGVRGGGVVVEMDRNAKTRGMELIAASFHLFSCRSAPGCVQVTPRSPVVDAVRLTADRTVSISSTAGEKC